MPTPVLAFLLALLATGSSGVWAFSQDPVPESPPASIAQPAPIEVRRSVTLSNPTELAFDNYFVQAQGPLALRDRPPTFFGRKGKQVGTTDQGAVFLVTEEKTVPTLFHSFTWVHVRPIRPSTEPGREDLWIVAGEDEGGWVYQGESDGKPYLTPFDTSRWLVELKAGSGEPE